MLTVFDKYMMRGLALTIVTLALSLTLIILLTQSIRFLELVIGSDASVHYLLIMIGLAIPKFLEAILPLSFAIAVIYIARRASEDREIVIMSGSGQSVPVIAKSFFVMTFVMMGVQFALSGWIAPLAVEQLQKTRQDVKSHYATLVFREGVFTTLGNGLTVFTESRQGLNSLNNLMIHDADGQFHKGKATTILARRGIVNLTKDQQQLLIYDGTQYQRDLKDGTISRLDFDQYTLDIPVQNTGSIGTRWQEPDERTFPNLFISADTGTQRDLRKQDEFIAEIHKRLSTPLLYPAFTLTIIMFLLMQTWDRRVQQKPVILAALVIIGLQALHIVAYNEARDMIWMNIMLYSLPLAVIGYGLYRIKHRSGRI